MAERRLYNYKRYETENKTYQSEELSNKPDDFDEIYDTQFYPAHYNDDEYLQRFQNLNIGDTSFRKPEGSYIAKETSNVKHSRPPTMPNHEDEDYFVMLRNNSTQSGKKLLNRTTSHSLRNSNDEDLTLIKQSFNIRSSSEPKKNQIGQTSALAREGKDIADFIVGSQRALDFFMSFYDEWAVCRTESISLLEKLVEMINEQSKRSDLIKNTLSKIDLVIKLAEHNPNPTVSFGAKIASAVGSIFVNLFGSNSNSKGNFEKKASEIREIFQKDIDTTSLVYIYGVQCGSQFDETCKFIKIFHRKLQGNHDTVMDDDVAFEFLNEISEYNPSNISVFYRRLRICYERLIKKSNSYESRAFVRVFQDAPEAVRVINLLPWRFNSDGFDSSIVENAWKEVFEVLHDEKATVEMFLDKIQNCLFFLKKEKLTLDRSVLDLLKEKF